MGPFSKPNVNKNKRNSFTNKVKKDDDESAYVQQESRLQCFLDINYLTRSGGNQSPRNANGKVEVEKIVTLQFLPNKEFLMIGTNRRLILVVLGPAKYQGVLYGSGMYPNIWNQSVQGLLSQSKENCLSNWFSQSPLSSPRVERNDNNNDDDDYYDNENYNENDTFSEKSFKNDNDIDLKNYKNIYENKNRKNENNKLEENGTKREKKSLNKGIRFLSWVELDRVPSNCQGIFSMSVSVCAPVIPGSDTESPEKLTVSTDTHTYTHTHTHTYIYIHTHTRIHACTHI